MDPFAILDQLRAAYPKMSAAALILGGAGLGWGIAWLILKQRLTHHRDLINHYKDVIDGKFPEKQKSSPPAALGKSTASNEPVKASAPLSDKKDFIQITPKYLMSLYENRTTFQGNVLAAAYIGKWTSVKCRILDINVVVGTVIVQARDEDGTLLSTTFHGDSSDPVQHLPLNAEVKIAGEISSVDTLSVKLKNCELVNGDAHVSMPLTRS